MLAVISAPLLNAVFDHAERLHPIYFEFPASRVDDVTIDLPAGWQVRFAAVRPARTLA
jgi:hypothetical protein